MARPTAPRYADPSRLHGPYARWTRKIDSETVTRNLTEDELSEYQPYFENAKRLRALMSELQNLGLVKAAPEPAKKALVSARWVKK